jgi:hypothetical protein
VRGERGQSRGQGGTGKNYKGGEKGGGAGLRGKRRADCVSKAHAQESAFLGTAKTSRDMPARKTCAFGTGGKKVALNRRSAPRCFYVAKQASLET